MSTMRRAAELVANRKAAMFAAFRDGDGDGPEGIVAATDDSIKLMVLGTGIPPQELEEFADRLTWAGLRAIVEGVDSHAVLRGVAVDAFLHGYYAAQLEAKRD